MILEDHIDHLKIAFRMLKGKPIVYQLGKYSFVQEELYFLGHRTRHGQIWIYRKKVHAILKWETLNKAMELRSFLNLVY